MSKFVTILVFQVKMVQLLRKIEERRLQEEGRRKWVPMGTFQVKKINFWSKFEFFMSKFVNILVFQV